MNSKIANNAGKRIVSALIGAIQENKQYLSDVDGLIGDGDHGVNMNKGFTLAGTRLTDSSISGSFETLGMALLEDIGGSMGPLYSSIFLGMADAAGTDGVDREVFGRMLENAAAEIGAISPAKVGDKTLMDTLVPACNAYQDALTRQQGFQACLEAMEQAAKEGKESTVDMAAKLGRASRLGERSRGVPDAGATSCYILLNAMAKEMIAILNGE